MNTRDNRASAIAVALPSGRAFWLPDGTIGQQDRQHAALAYRAIVALALSASAHRMIGIDLAGREVIVDLDSRAISVAGAARTIQ